MRKLAMLAIIATLGGSGYYTFTSLYPEGISPVSLLGDSTGGDGSVRDDQPPVKRAGDTIRVASFNIQVFGETKSGKPHVMDYLARIVRQFDVVAVQQITARSDDLLPRFVDLVNATGRHYDYVIGPRTGPEGRQEQLAFLFDRASIEVDRTQLYTVDDPDDLVTHDPLVGWFRVRGPEPQQALTFTVVNVRVDGGRSQQELNALAQVYRAVRQDGRGEDDVLLAGDFQSEPASYGALARVPEIGWVAANIPTDVRQTAQLDNIVFHRRATAEFTGRGGVYDFMRELNLTTEEAVEISDRLPVWVELNIYEGGQPGRVAVQPQPIQ